MSTTTLGSPVSMDGGGIDVDPFVGVELPW